MMRRGLRLLVIVVALLTSPALAQFGVPWRHVPDVVVVSASADPRVALVEEALAFWNRTLEELGSGFRLGPVTHVVKDVPEDALQALSNAIVGGRRPVAVPQALRGWPGDLTILLAQSDFVSFAGPFDPDAKRVVGIKGASHRPLNLPNVARNVIAHEIGHAIGLGHNSDPANLMCGRPAPCRPDAFRADEPRLFPLTEAEKRQLLSMYPADWKAEGR